MDRPHFEHEDDTGDDHGDSRETERNRIGTDAMENSVDDMDSEGQGRQSDYTKWNRVEDDKAGDGNHGADKVPGITEPSP